MAKLFKRQMLVYAYYILSHALNGKKEDVASGFFPDMVCLDDCGVPENRIEEVCKFLAGLEIDVNLHGNDFGMRTNSRVYFSLVTKTVMDNGRERKQVYANIADEEYAAIALMMIGKHLEVSAILKGRQDK